MANHLYGYSSSYGALPQSQPPPPGVSAATSNLSALYSSRSLSLSDPYLPDSTRYLHHRHFDADRPSSMYEILRYSGTDIGGYSSAASRIPGVGTTAAAQLGSWSTVDVDTAIDPVATGIKRAADEAIYHQTLYGAHSTIGQSEAWYSTNSLAKRPRFESASNLPIYPQRPGEKDCAHYMLTRACKFGDSCKYDHPIWVPEGGIPDWKEVPQIASDESLPERPGEPDCPYYLKTQRCKFGPRCKFNHPKDNLVALGASENVDISALPERPSEQPCAFYMKTGKCKFGVTCKFHHPKDIQIPLAGEENGNTEQTESAVNTYGTIGDAKAINPVVLPTPALLHNSKGLPIRLGEVDCPFYLKTGSCKYGATCRYNHPDRIAINPPAAALGSAIVTSPAPNLNIGVVNPAASLYQTIDPRLAQPMLGVSPTIYPQRPGQIECDFYMKTGECKFGERCKFHHPVDRSAPTQTMAKQAAQQNVKLTLAGLPRREGAIICPYYLKTGTCKYGASCRFDHPPPGEVMAMAASQGISTSVEGEANEGEAVEEQQQ